MSFMRTTALVGFIASVSHVAAHGRVSGIVADGVYYEGYSAGFQYSPKPPVVVGWSIPKDINTGFIAPDAYGSPDIICHLDATPGGTSATVKAGGTVELQWTPWPTGHHGPVIDYLANCNGNCSSVDKTTLKFGKIDEMGLIDDNIFAGNWASDKMITTNNTWTVTIPATTAPGNYVLRHEIIALHSAQNANGAQNYPQCVNLEVTGAGTDSFTSGTLGEALYKATDPGIAFNIYTKLPSYPIPGPTLYKGATATPKGNTTSATVPQSTSVTGSQSTVVVSSSPSTIVSQSTYGNIPESTSTTISGSSGSGVETATSTSAAAITITTEAYNTGTSTPVVTSTPTNFDTYASSMSPTMSIAESTVIDVSSSSASAIEAVVSTAIVSTTDAAVTATTEVSNTMTTVPDVTYESSTSAANADPTTTPASVAAPTTPAVPTAEPSTSPTGPTKSMKPLPPGTTLEQLLEWLEIMLLSMFKDGEKSVHARAF